MRLLRAAVWKRGLTALGIGNAYQLGYNKSFGANTAWQMYTQAGNANPDGATHAWPAAAARVTTTSAVSRRALRGTFP
jgi:hypothetical protein